MLAAVGVPVYQSAMERSRRTTTEANLRLIKEAIQTFNFDTNSLPTKLTDLTKRPTDEKIKAKWHGAYLDPVPEEDGWGNSFVYKPTPTQPKKFELYSHGPNGPGSPKDERIGEYN
jgi:type II secretion system protein G